MNELIVRIAARGDGVTASGRHVPFGVPGDAVLDDGALAFGAHHQQPPRRRAMIADQPKPGEAREEARLGGTIERAGSVRGHRVEIVEQSDVNRQALCPFAPALS